jgi:hypothetical protein
MRVNIYAEEMTDRLEIISKEIDGHKFTGLRLYLELPVSLPDGQQHRGPFFHRPGDDDSAAITFWGKRDLRVVLRKALEMLDAHYGTAPTRPAVVPEGALSGEEIENIQSRITCHRYLDQSEVNALCDQAKAAIRSIADFPKPTLFWVRWDWRWFSDILHWPYPEPESSWHRFFRKIRGANSARVWVGPVRMGWRMPWL